MTDSVDDRIDRLDWHLIEQGLDAHGWATTGPLLTSAECCELIAVYNDDSRFRSRVDMARHNFGSGEYKYFGRPLPTIVQQLRTALYRRLAPVASGWATRLGEQPFPTTLEAFLDLCAAHGQTRPTPLLLRYRAGDYNCLHQDLYGDVAFPVQVTFALSRLRQDYIGGEFLLTEQRPRAQSRGQAVSLEQGEAIIFTTHHRPVPGVRGFYRVNVRHGVSRLSSGERFTLGVIFHDAR